MSFKSGFNFARKLFEFALLGGNGVKCTHSQLRLAQAQRTAPL